MHFLYMRNNYLLLCYSLFGVVIQVFSMQSYDAKKDSIARCMRELGIGACAGIADVTTTQPLMYIKSRLQPSHQYQDALGVRIKSLAADIYARPSVMYRGYGMNVMAVAPTLSVQKAVSTYLNSYPALDRYPWLGAGLAGVASTSVCTPTELIMLHQQDKGSTLRHAMRALLQQHGPLVLWRGIMPKMVREAVFAAGWLRDTSRVQDETGCDASSSDTSRLIKCIADVAVGIGVGVITHPVDTLSTYMQRDPGKERVKSAYSAACSLYKLYGGRVFFHGVVPRSGSIAAGFLVLTSVNDCFKSFDE